jgi:hypothetical protein
LIVYKLPFSSPKKESVRVGRRRKGKAIAVTGRGGPQDYELRRLPHYVDNRLTDGGEVASLTR